MANQQDDGDTITVGGDGDDVLREIDVPPGAEIDRSADGSVTTIKRPNETMQVFVDETTAVGAKIRRAAHQRGETPEEFVVNIAREAADDALAGD